MALQEILFQQPTIPDYRMGVYLLLRRHWGEEFQIVAGEEDFDRTPRAPDEAWRHFRWVRNRYLFKRKYLWQSGCLLHMISVDILVANKNMRVLSTWVALVVRRLLRRKTILWGHAGGQVAMAKRLRGLYLRLGDGCITYTHSERKYLQNAYRWLSVWVAANACVFAKDCRPVQATSEEVDSILYVGRLIERKKVTLLLEGFVEALRQQAVPPTVRLVYIGDGPELGKLKADAHRAGAVEKVIFTGHISEVDALRGHYRRAVCAVSPGYVGLSATQSFGFGVPMVVADGEFHSPEIEACREGFNTEFFRSDDVGDLARVLAKVYRNREAWLQRRSEISDWTQRNYTFEIMRDGFIEAINAVKVA